MPIVLDPAVGFSVLSSSRSEVERREELGCGLQGPASRPVRRALASLRTRIARMGKARAVVRAEELLAWLDDRPVYRALCHPTRKVEGRRRLRDDVLFPDPRLQQPRIAHVRRGSSALEVHLPAQAWPQLADVLAAIAAGVRIPRVTDPSLQDLLAELAGARFLHEGEPAPPLDAGVLRDACFFAGHNTVLVSSRTTRVIVDPWLRPWHEGDPRGYRPVLPHQLPPVDAILLTHSHGDHFHLGSLLHLPRETPVLVPRVPRESVLSTDLSFRLAQVGFTRVRPVSWWEELRVGDLRITALPFFGEQPTTMGLVYPQVRNAGNTWIVRTPRLSAALLADSGRDAEGDMRSAALEARRRAGPVDVLFTGARSFRLHPILFPFTTLDAFLLNVPLPLAGVEQQLMNGGDDALDVAEAIGARTVVPYADGGAPWYWREGMGPTYPGYPSYAGERESPGVGHDDPRSDPFPERLVELARHRYQGEGPVHVEVLRPGDVLHASGKVTRIPGLAWPYGEPRGPAPLMARARAHPDPRRGGRRVTVRPA